MKLFKYGLPFAALAILASCSNDNIDAPVNGGEQNAVEGEGMYMTINISLPAGLGTKADDGSLADYEEGSADEYAVNSMKLYLFKASDETDPEANAEYFDVIDLDYGSLETATPDDVTKKAEATFQISSIKLNSDKEPEDGSVYYGLLILNGNDKLPAFTDKIKFNEWNKEVMSLASTGGQNDYVNLMKNGAYFTMSNAPMYVKTSEVGSPDTYAPQTLVKIETKNFALSPKAATVPAATFYVQRGVAKVYLSNESFNAVKVTLDGESEETTAKVKVLNWALDNTNQLTFPVQNVYGTGTSSEFDKWNVTTNDYFLAEPNNFTGSQAFTHIWWGVDPNYSGNETEASHGTAFTKLFENADGELVQNVDCTLAPKYDATDANTFAYCLENTMDYTQMIKKQTTRVVFKCLYLPTGTDTYYDETNNPTGVDAGFAVYNDVVVLIKKEHLASANEKGSVSLASLIDATKKVYIKEGAVVDSPEDAQEITALEYYRQCLKMGNTSNNVTYYPGGVTYYVAYIRHFNDVETKLPSAYENGTKDLSDLTNQDLTQANGWDACLGRYGVLRNNAYAMNVKMFYGFGNPTIPTIPNTPDDNEPEKKYNAIVDVNILNWAKRVYDYVPR